jgi:hypothetical protein
LVPVIDSKVLSVIHLTHLGLRPVDSCAEHGKAQLCDGVIARRHVERLPGDRVHRIA